jgi:hypothetical protein
MGDDERGELMQQWQRAVQRAGGWARG